jgi:hypothetical protein
VHPAQYEDYWEKPEISRNFGGVWQQCGVVPSEREGTQEAQDSQK